MEAGSRVLAGVVRRFLPAYRRTHPLSREQRQAARAIVKCKTPALGGHEYTCGPCGHRQAIYHGCRNRHCPQCQGRKSRQWLEAQQNRLLPVPHYHAVFTVAAELRTLFAWNRRLLYGLLFQISAQALQTFAQDPQWLGARIGFVGILHTWGQQLVLHPHIHYLVTGGGLDAQGRWVWPRCPGKFLFPVVALSRWFQERFLRALRRLDRQGRLVVPPGLDLERCLEQAGGKPWEIYLQPPTAGPDKLLRYLGRYTQRVAISPARILEVDATHVRFRYRDYRRNGQTRELRLTGTEFLGRFLQHVLPKGFRRIRHYGLWGADRQPVLEAIARERQLQLALLLAALRLGEKEPEPFPEGPPCPQCGQPMRPGRCLDPNYQDSS